MKRFFMLLSLVACSFAILNAQDDELPPPSSHPQPQINEFTGKPVYTGPIKPKKIDLSNYLIEPGLHVSFMQGGFNIGASPYLGYRIWKNLYAGAGVTYLYTGYRNIGYPDAGGAIHYTNANGNTYGGGVLLQYNIWRGFFVRDRFEVLHRTMDDVYDATLNVNPQNNTTSIYLPKIQKTIPDMLIGAGYNLLQTKNIFIPVMFCTTHYILLPTSFIQYILTVGWLPWALSTFFKYRISIINIISNCLRATIFGTVINVFKLIQLTRYLPIERCRDFWLIIVI